MARKNEKVRKIDLRKENTGTGGLPLIQEEQILSPAPRTLPAPDTLTLSSSGILRSTQAPLAYVVVTWNEAPNISPEYYNVEWDESSSFTNPQRARAYALTATIQNLKINTTYYIRVQAIVGGLSSDYSDTLPVVTPGDNTAPPVVTGLAGSFNNGDLKLTWTNPSSEVFKDVEIRIYNAAHSILLATYHTNAQQFIWTAEQNIRDSGGTASTSVQVDIYSRSWTNTYSASPVNATITSTSPTAPNTVTFNWTGDNGMASADLIVSWLASQLDDSYALTFDGVSYSTKDTRFNYRYDRNVQDHTPTLKSGDAVITYTLAAKNKLGQVSSLVSGTITNAAPPSSLVGLTAVAGFSQIAAQVSVLSGAIIQDFDHWQWTLVSGAANIQQFTSTTPDVIFLLSGSGTYTVKVKAVDKFNQSSADVISSALTMDVLTITQLRSEAYYTDSLGRSSPALDVLKDDDTGTFASYPTTGVGVFNWTKVERPTIDRYGVVSVNAAGSTQVYVGLSTDDITYTWYSGPLTGTVLTQVADESAAKTAAVTVTSDNRVDIPVLKDARFIKIGHRNGIGTYFIFTLYPRRIVESDDIRAENIKSINVAAGAITANKISVINLQAVSANMGNLHMDGVIDIATTGGIYQGTGSFASPGTGLKIFNSGGIGVVQTLNSGVIQVMFDTDGKFYAAAGKIKIDANGLTAYNASNVEQVKITTSGQLLAGAGTIILDANGLSVDNTISSFSDPTSIKLKFKGVTRAQIWGYDPGTTSPNIYFQARNAISNTIMTFDVSLASNSSVGTNSLQVSAGAETVGFTAQWLGAASSPNSRNTIHAYQTDIDGDVTIGGYWTSGTLNVGSGINVGSATGAGAGEIKTSGRIFPKNTGVAYSTNIIGSIANNGVAALSVTANFFGFAFIWAGGAAAIYAINGTNNTTTEISDPSAIFSATAGTASSINVSWGAGNSRYEIENKRGSAIAARIWLFES